MKYINMNHLYRHRLDLKIFIFILHVFLKNQALKNETWIVIISTFQGFDKNQSCIVNWKQSMGERTPVLCNKVKRRETEFYWRDIRERILRYVELLYWVRRMISEPQFRAIVIIFEDKMVWLSTTIFWSQIVTLRLTHQ